MRTVIFIILLGLPFTLLQAQNPSIIEALEGTWKRVDKPMYETWQRHGDTLLGRVYTLNNGMEIIKETLVIEKIEGNWRYVATVPDQNNGQPIPFELNESEKNILSFENPEHDFPTKIRYHLISSDRIKIEVLGPDNQGFSFYMNKI